MSRLLRLGTWRYARFAPCRCSVSFLDRPAYSPRAAVVVPFNRVATNTYQYATNTLVHACVAEWLEQAKPGSLKHARATTHVATLVWAKDIATRRRGRGKGIAGNEET